ncbi:MAG: hypothetical protein P0Y56_15760 [Candidatus Andeanibacterium colombiense]|uniref:Uncharacterized protein n=1 Tax=Candidatus Andeanibacterium colombiense TaxID=3121345 RepID=A0AAJ5X6D7_9SPHN|nr:MAG: hypothetical protein P0Y56_15760 [Sphingomonadaceae bacterium]
MDEQELERVAARMRQVGERLDLLATYERLRIAVRQQAAGLAAPTFRPRPRQPLGGASRGFGCQRRGQAAGRPLAAGPDCDTE